jgi:hypothetical protein
MSVEFKIIVVPIIAALAYTFSRTRIPFRATIFPTSTCALWWCRLASPTRADAFLSEITVLHAIVAYATIRIRALTVAITSFYPSICLFTYATASTIRLSAWGPSLTSWAYRRFVIVAIWVFVAKIAAIVK